MTITAWVKTAAAAWMVVVLTGSISVADPPIADAAMKGDLERVRELVRQGADVNASQGDGMTALHWAAEKNDAETARVLLYAGAKVDARTRVGAFTPLLVASRTGSADLVEVLLANGADPNDRTSTAGTTALHFAAGAGNARAVEVLLEHGAELEAVEEASGHTPLMFAAAYGRQDAVRVLLDHGADLGRTNRVEDMGERAAEDQELRNLRTRRVTLLQEIEEERQALRGEREEAEAEPSEAEAQEQSAEPEEPEEAEAPAAEETEAEEEAGEEAEEEARSEEASEEEPAPAEPEEEVEEVEAPPTSFAERVGGYGGFSALHLAARQGHHDVVMTLLDEGADLNQPSRGDHSTPLLIATINGHWDLARELLRRGADPNIASEHGATPLYGVINLQWAPRAFYPQPRAHLNQEVTYLELMAELLEAGADPDARLFMHLWYKSYNFDVLGIDSWGATPFWRAAYGTDVEGMKLLVSYGADPTIATRSPEPRRRGFGPQEADPSGISVHRTGSPSLSPLHAASGAGYGQGYAANAHQHVPGGWLPSVKYLVEEHGLDVNARDHNGFTPLHHAAARGDVEVIRYLVDQGADVTVVSRSGHTTADMANGPVQRLPPYPAAIRLLEQLGSHNNDDCRSC